MSTWNIDQAHSEIGFKVKHLVVSTVKGSFANFSGSLTSSDDTFADAKIFFEADVASITTNNAQRDGHLKSGDFFDVENSPKITFVSKSFSKNGGDSFTLVGDFTMRGVTKEITLNVVSNGINTNPMDGLRVTSFDLTGKINRMDFGVKWNVALETGGFMVSEEVMLDIGVEMKEAKA